MTNRTSVNDYQSAMEYLDGGKDSLYRSTEYKTAIVTDGNCNPVVRLFNTHILTYHKDGSVTLNSGTWKTKTTKSRLNDYQDVCVVYQDKNVWYVAVKDGDSYYWDTPEEERIPFEDGMRVHPDGTVVYPGDAAPDTEEIRDLAEEVNDFAHEIAKRLVDGEIEDGARYPFPGPEEILEYIEHEKYPARLVMAGAKIRGLASLPTMWLQQALAGEKLGEWEGDILADNIYRGVRKYMRLQLDLPA